MAARLDLLETNRNLTAQLNYIRGQMTSMRIGRSTKFNLKVNNRNVCAVAFEAWWGISRHYRLKIKNSILKNQSIKGIHKNSSLHRDKQAEALVYGFLENFCKYCEHQPDSEEIHTMQSIRKMDIYVDFEESLKKMVIRTPPFLSRLPFTEFGVPTFQT